MSKHQERTTAATDVVPPTPVDLASIREYWEEHRRDLTRQVSEIEKFLGFVQQSDDLAVRVAKIEAFLGINKG